MFWRFKNVGTLSEWLRKPWGRPDDIFSVNDPLYADNYPQASPGKVVSEVPGKNVFSGKVIADKSCFLLFKMTYHPCWHAYVDGKEQKTVILSPGMVGVKLARGTHEVNFVYRAQWWKMPLLYLGLLVMAGLFVFEKKRK